MKAVIALIVSLISMLCTFQTASANDLFYSGDIVTHSVAVNIDIGDQEANVNAVYLLGNRGTQTKEIVLGYGYSPASLQIDGETLENPVVFNPGDRKSVTVNFTLNSTGETTKTLSLDPTLLFNGSPNSEPAATVTIKALLPEGVNGLVWVSQKPVEESRENGRTQYYWKDTDIYPTQLTLKWSTLGIDLGIEKSASPAEIKQQDQVINIEITLANNGDTELKDIHLVDQYVSSHFSDINPAAESGAMEEMIFWQKTINTLGQGETTTLKYSVKYIGTVSDAREFDLNPTVVTVAGNLVSVSNKVRMKLETEATVTTPEAQTVTKPDTNSDLESEPGAEKPGDSTWPYAMYIGIAVMVIAIVSVGYIIYRRKSKK
jgi:hypothetical protein